MASGSSRDGLAVAYAAIRQSGYEDWDIRLMLAIAGAESSWIHDSISSTHDYGMWQINSHYWGDLFKTWQWDDPWQNVIMAHAVWKAQGNTAWVTYNTGAYTRYLPTVDKYLDSRPQYVPQRPAPTGGVAQPVSGDGDYSQGINAHGRRWQQHGQAMSKLRNLINGI